MMSSENAQHVCILDKCCQKSIFIYIIHQHICNLCLCKHQIAQYIISTEGSTSAEVLYIVPLIPDELQQTLSCMALSE